MGEAIGNFLPAAVGIALSPFPIIAVVLMLGTPRGRSNAIAFLVGWIAGLTIVGTAALLASSGAGASSGGEPEDWVSAVQLVLALGLVAVAVRQWRSRPGSDGEPAMPRWMQTIDTFTPPRSGAIGAALSAINPKNLLLTLSGAAAIAGAGLSASQQAISMGIFILIATIGPAVPLVIYLVMGDRAGPLLGGMREWLSRNNQAIMSVICLLIAAKLAGDAITGLS